MNVHDKLHLLEDRAARLAAEYRQVSECAQEHRMATIRLGYELIIAGDPAGAAPPPRSPAERAALPVAELEARGIQPEHAQRILASQRAAERAERERGRIAVQLASARSLYQRCITYARRRGLVA